MTTTTNAFVANGPAGIGFEAKSSSARNPLKFGALAVGHSAGVYGAIDDIAIPPTATIWDEAAVVGTSNNKHGVFGISWTRCGVMGQWGLKPTLLQPFLPAAAAVMGLARDADGVVGASDHADGVTGQSYWANGISGSSTYGFAVDASTELGSAAIRAQTIAGTGYGVLGMAAGNAGIFGISGSGGPTRTPTAGVVGTSDQNRGVIGTSNAHQGVYGFSSLNAGVVGESGSAQSFGGYFFGNVHMTGTLTSDSVKGAVVPFPDGTKRLLVCMESPEPWFEDFGAGKLKRGRAVVRIDRDFAKVIKRADYHVFLTPRGDRGGLYVRSQGGASFEVRELAGGTSSAAFSYRIVGRRKDVKATAASPRSTRVYHCRSRGRGIRAG